ncbi:hypothetical protein ACTFIW_000475 [Dictyostelium discoideum]
MYLVNIKGYPELEWIKYIDTNCETIELRKTKRECNYINRCSNCIISTLSRSSKFLTMQPITPTKLLKKSSNMRPIQNGSGTTLHRQFLDLKRLKTYINNYSFKKYQDFIPYPI